MSIQIVDSTNKTIKGTLDTVDDGVDCVRYGVKILKTGLAKERRISLVEEYEDAQKQDEGKTYSPEFTAKLADHDAGLIV